MILPTALRGCASEIRSSKIEPAKISPPNEPTLKFRLGGVGACFNESSDLPPQIPNRHRCRRDEVEEGRVLSLVGPCCFEEVSRHGVGS